jgi:xanthine dehydrogenase YagS FAD-binding subunit
VRPFRYERPSTAEAAVATLTASPDATYLGGGTNLVDLMRLGVAEPSLLVDVNRVAGAEITETEGGGLMVGAAVKNSTLAVDPRVRERYPVLSQALLNGASGQLRNLATVGGNLLQRTRCVYFQDVTRPCNKRSPGSGCPARQGDHYNLAILGHSEQCVATHPSDMAVALAALDAVVHVQGTEGTRSIPLVDFHRLPEDRPERDTTLERGELITAVELPRLDAARRSHYRKARERRSFSFALVSVATVLALDPDDHVAEVRIALGGVAHKPWRAHRAEAVLRGGALNEQTAGRAAEAELEAASPLRDNGYKLPLARNLIVSTLLELAGGA